MISVVCSICWLLGSNIAIMYKDCTYRTCGQCCVFRILVVGSYIVIGLYVLDKWSVLCVPYVGGGI